MWSLARLLASVRWTLERRPRQNLSSPGATYLSTVTEGRLQGTVSNRLAPSCNWLAPSCIFITSMLGVERPPHLLWLGIYI